MWSQLKAEKRGGQAYRSVFVLIVSLKGTPYKSYAGVGAPWRKGPKQKENDSVKETAFGGLSPTPLPLQRNRKESRCIFFCSLGQEEGGIPKA